MSQRIQTKASLSDNELVTDDTAGSAYIYNFASRVFDGADATDRGGKATRSVRSSFTSRNPNTCYTRHSFGLYGWRWSE